MIVEILLGVDSILLVLVIIIICIVRELIREDITGDYKLRDSSNKFYINTIERLESKMDRLLRDNGWTGDLNGVIKDDDTHPQLKRFRDEFGDIT